MKVESVLTNDGQKKGQHAKMQVRTDFQFDHLMMKLSLLYLLLSGCPYEAG